MISRGIPPLPLHLCCRCFFPKSCVFLKAPFPLVLFHFWIPFAASPSLHTTATLLCFSLAPELPSRSWPCGVLESKGRGEALKGGKITNKMRRKKAGFGDGGADPALELSPGCEMLLQATHSIFSPHAVPLGCLGCACMPGVARGKFGETRKGEGWETLTSFPG